MTDRADDRKTKKRKVVRLEDLAPRQDVLGGAGKLVFGEGVVEQQGDSGRTARPARSRAREPKDRD
ncbi:MAG TPA: hypothetical protein VMS64_13030 [Candidatus Methylomirabilis sp.]|nr:hypothetical protein [Candidatus Methylomirabilis sp.]